MAEYLPFWPKAAIGAFVANGGTAEIQGIELQMDWLPSDSLRIGAGLAYYDSELKDDYWESRLALADVRARRGETSVAIEHYRKARELIADAIAALAPLGPAADPIRALAHFVIERRS